VVQHMRYPDHHPFTQVDLNDIMAQRDRHSATVVMTTKDAVKMRNRGLDGALVLEVALGFAEGDAERLISLLTTTLSCAPGASDSTTSGYKP
jgi:tetraacyldisaccharide-1-P 4'-kinase